MPTSTALARWWPVAAAVVVTGVIIGSLLALLSRRRRGQVITPPVLPHVAAAATSLNLKVILLEVTPEEHVYWRGLVYPVGHVPEFISELDKKVREYMEGIAEQLRGQGVLSVEVQSIEGHPADAIVDLAHETADDLIAITSHGRSGLGRLLVGSVADQVVCHSGDPVLLIRIQPTAET